MLRYAGQGASIFFLFFLLIMAIFSHSFNPLPVVYSELDKGFGHGFLGEKVLSIT